MAASTTASARTLALALFAATAALTPASVSSTEVLPVDVAAKFGAKCLDGSPPTFELTRNVSSTKWVLFLEGGGWCFGPDANATLESCAHRAGFVWPPVSEGERGAGDKQRDTPSSSNNNNNFRVKESQLQDPTSMQFQSFANNLPQFATTSSSADIGGVMAQDPAVNPDFYTWNKVFLHYCDGSSFGGGRDEPIAVSTHDGKPAQMWMRGRNNFNALIAYLQDTIGMANATEVILSGGSAGGLAVFYNVDHLATLLPEGVRLTAFPDAGFFLDAVDTTGEHSYRAGFQGADPVWNVTGSGGANLLLCFCAVAHRCLGMCGAGGSEGSERDFVLPRQECTATGTASSKTFDCTHAPDGILPFFHFFFFCCVFVWFWFWFLTVSGTNAKCLAANGGEEWKCLMAPYLAQYIETPLFVMNSVYDAYQLPNVRMGIPAVSGNNHRVLASQRRLLRLSTLRWLGARVTTNHGAFENLTDSRKNPCVVDVLLPTCLCTTVRGLDFEGSLHANPRKTLHC